MHPYFSQELARIKIEEQLQYSERERRARRAVSAGPHPIDFSGLVGRVRLRVLALTDPFRGRPAKAGAL